MSTVCKHTPHFESQQMLVHLFMYHNYCQCPQYAAFLHVHPRPNASYEHACMYMQPALPAVIKGAQVLFALHLQLLKA